MRVCYTVTYMIYSAQLTWIHYLQKRGKKNHVPVRVTGQKFILILPAWTSCEKERRCMLLLSLETRYRLLCSVLVWIPTRCITGRWCVSSVHPTPSDHVLHVLVSSMCTVVEHMSLHPLGAFSSHLCCMNACGLETGGARAAAQCDSTVRPVIRESTPRSQRCQRRR